MDEGRNTLELFTMPEEEGPPSNVLPHPGYNGIIPYQALRQMILQQGELRGPEIAEDQFQPASFDLRLGKRAWRVRASFLPGHGRPVESRLRELGGEHEMSLKDGAVLEKGIVYVVELLEYAPHQRPSGRDWRLQS